MNIAFTLWSIGGIFAAVVLFIILKKVVGLVLRLVLAGVLVLAVMIGAWSWSKPSESTGRSNANKTARPQQTPRRR